MKSGYKYKFGLKLPMKFCSLQHSSGIMFPSPHTAPFDPTWEAGKRKVVAPAKTQKFLGLLLVPDMIIPIFVTSPPLSFIPTMFGCLAHSIATSAGKSNLFFKGNYDFKTLKNILNILSFYIHHTIDKRNCAYPVAMGILYKNTGTGLASATLL